MDVNIKLIDFILETRNLLKEILMAHNRPVKNTSKKHAYDILSKLQEKYKTNTIINDDYFLMTILGVEQ